MKIRITTSCSGLNFSYAEGQIVDADRRIGNDLVKCGFAEEIKEMKIAAETKKKTIKGKMGGEDNGGDD